MISDCFGLQQWDLSATEAIFVQGVFALLKILIPVGIFVYTWKVCQSEQSHHRTTLFKLEEPREAPANRLPAERGSVLFDI